MSLGRNALYALLALGLGAFASTGAAAASAEPGVARVSLLHGRVELKRADSGDSVAATINAPVNPGDYLTTRDDARSEIEFGYATALRIAPSTDLRFVALDAAHDRVQLAAGTVELRLARGTRAHAEIETPQVTVRPTETGRYRVTVAGDGATTVTVRSGHADVVGDAGTRTLEAGAALAFSATPGTANPTTTVAAAPDDFDRWNDDRDATLADAATNANENGYVDDGIVGASDLGSYGRWIDNARYGRVWSPYEGSSWAPYRDGRFVWEPYYGWTWVASEPWGWAPYHYGNWFYAGNSGWCWYPGAYAFSRPFGYRPAVVGFFSFGAYGASFGFGNIGWVPLAPYERYSPWYGGYANQTVINNITNVTNVTNVYDAPGGNAYAIYHNLRAPHGASGLDRHSFENGNFARRVDPDRATLVRAAPFHGIVPIVPTTANLRLTPGRVTPVPVGEDLGKRFAHFSMPTTATRPFVATQAAITAATANALTSMMPRANPSIVRPAIVRRAATEPTRANVEIVRPQIVRPEVVRPAIVRTPSVTPETSRPTPTTHRSASALPTIIYLDGEHAAALPVRGITSVVPRESESAGARAPSPWDRFHSRDATSEITTVRPTSVERPGRIYDARPRIDRGFESSAPRARSLERTEPPERIVPRPLVRSEAPTVQRPVSERPREVAPPTVRIERPTTPVVVERHR